MAAKRERILSRWGFVMAGGSGPVLAGEEGLGMHRTSTPLVSFDADTMTGVTASGRPYRLAGEHEPGYALSVFHSLWDADGVDVRIVGLEEALVLIEGNKPFAFSPEELVGLPVEKLQALLEHDASGITPDEADRVLTALVAKLWGYRTGNAVARAKDDAAVSIGALIHECGLAMAEAAEVVGMEAKTLRGIVERGHVDGISLERLDRVVEALESAPASGRKL